ncbi:SLAM family member 6 isoform X1 [Vulpes vulpes]|uniref:SLAM family member 6 isoform X1 n=1 Tax=Vulpes vulpes TaxID=9627 RepID=A0ABM5ALW1_VULVU
MLWVLPPLLLLLLVRPGNTASQDSSNPQTMNGILGESVTLSPKLPVGEDIQSITWIHSGRSLIIILPKVEQVLVTDPKWKHRLQSLENYSLRLSNLTMEDAGLYCAQITISTASELSCYTLKIFRRLSVLNITVHPGLSKTGTCEVHLACSVENSHDTLLKWHGAGNTSIYEANLTISWDPRNRSEQKYTCVAENIVSSTSSSVSIQSLCEGFLNQKNQHLDTIWIIVVAILMFTVILVGLFVWRKKGCLCRTGKGREDCLWRQPLGCGHTPANFPREVGPTRKCATKPQGLAALLLQAPPPPHPLERHLWAGDRVWEPVSLHSQMSISRILFFRHLSFLYSANAECCSDHEELRLCLLLSREHRVCLCHSSKQANEYPNTWTKWWSLHHLLHSSSVQRE